jgi:hypothetical protein
MVVLSSIKIRKAIMAKNYKEINYFETRPDIVKIFDDLEAFHNWCRLEMAPFDESHLYNRESWAWRNYDKSRRPKNANGERKPYLGKNPRYTKEAR